MGAHRAGDAVRFICASDGCSPRVYDDFWSEDPIDVAAEYAEFCDEGWGEGPSKRVVFVRDLDDPVAKIVAVSVDYEMEPVYSGAECNDEPPASVTEDIDAMVKDGGL